MKRKSRGRRSRRKGNARSVQAKSPHSAVDGVEYFQHIPEVRRELKGTDLLTSNIWPVDQGEKEESVAYAMNYTHASSRVIGTSVEGAENFGLPGGNETDEPEKNPIFSSKTIDVDGKKVMIGETAEGQVKIEAEFPGLSSMDAEQRKAFLEMIGKQKVTPLGDELRVYNACSTTLLDGGHRLVLPKEDIPLVEKTFWNKIIFVGIDTIGDIDEAAAKEFSKSPNGILMRLRKMAEKLGSALNEDPVKIIMDLVSSAALQSRFIDQLRWFMDRIDPNGETYGDDQLFVGVVAYTILAREGINPTLFTGGARSLAENAQFYHEYRELGNELFTSEGITQLFYEMFVVGGEKLKMEANVDMPFETAQLYAQASQFVREMTEVVARRELFMRFVKTGSFE